MKDDQRSQQDSPWQKTQYANLVRYKSSGVYFARMRVQGKLIRRSLTTDSISVAKLRLSDLEAEERKRAENQTAVAKGKVTFGSALGIFKERIEGQPNFKPKTKSYYSQRVIALLKSWPGLEKTDIRKISKTDCLNWGARFSGQTSPIAYNHTVSVLRRVFDIGLEMGVRYDNPAKSVEWVKESSKKLRLPEPHQFEQFLKEIETSGSGFAKRCADLVRFLAYGGFRIGEATNVCWNDIDFPRNKIIVRGDPETGLKGRLAGEDRQVPMIPEMRLLLERLRRERPAETLEDRVMQVRECQKAMNRAAKIVGLTRITHHDLRHLFATRCIEAGVDIPTVSRWLGHKDGGALAMRVYGHLRDKHSVEMSQKVRFAENEQDKINQVKAKYSFQWWESKSPLEIFWGQANEESRLVSADVFQKAAEEALGRTVKPQELGVPQTLILEFIEQAPKAALIELIKKMPKITSLAA